MNDYALNTLLDIPAHEYHASPGLSNSMLSDLAKSPAHFWAWHLNPNRPAKVPTAAMRAGTMLHRLVLEPEAFGSQYIVRPGGLDLRTKAGKEWQDSIAQHVEVLSSDQMEIAERQRNALMAEPVIAEALSTGLSERSCYWTDSSTGALCRARPDHVRFTGGNRVTVVDLKSTSDVMQDEFAKSIARFGYHRQAAHYIAGLSACGYKIDEFIFATVTSSYPFIAAAYVLDDESLLQGQEEVHELLTLHAGCTRLDLWRAFGSGVQLIGLPKWARRESEIEVAYV